MIVVLPPLLSIANGRRHHASSVAAVAPRSSKPFRNTWALPPATPPKTACSPSSKSNVSVPVSTPPWSRSTTTTTRTSHPNPSRPFSPRSRTRYRDGQVGQGSCPRPAEPQRELRKQCWSHEFARPAGVEPGDHDENGWCFGCSAINEYKELKRVFPFSRFFLFGGIMEWSPEIYPPGFYLYSTLFLRFGISFELL